MAGNRSIRARVGFVVAAFALTFTMLSPVGASAAEDDGALDMYTAEVSGTDEAELAAGGFDVANRTVTETGVSLDLVLTAEEAKALQARGLDVKVKKNKDGKSARQLAQEQAAEGYEVFRSWDEPGGIRDELYQLAKKNPQLVKLEVLGHTYQGREIIAMKLTQAAKGTPDGARPAVLYSSTQHAREWISTEVNRRLMNYYIDGWKNNDKAIKNLLKQNELWFVVVANPDGYQYTFDHERLWRKNLRDNDGDGQVTRADGVDPNRNYPEHFGWDEEGSSSQSSSDTYRGPEAGSEPETQAMMSLFDRADFSFQVNYHSYGQWLLYAEGWQTGTPTADDPIYYALSGNRDNPAIPGFEPGLSSDVLYVTNGETTDFAHAQRGTLAWTPELGEGLPAGGGFVFPDDEAQVQAEFERALPFALDVAKSAADPDDPVSHLGLETKPFYLESDDTYKAGLPLVDFTFDYSYGDPQEVRVIAKRELGDVTLKYSIEGGDPVSVPTEEWTGGDRYGGTGVHYRVMSGLVTGPDPGDEVEVWFEGGGESSDSFTYEAVEESADDVLILSAEDYTGASPTEAVSAPKYLDYYTDALDANGIGYDVYDVDARGRTAPDALGVLSHYEAVVWYTGDDIITREPGGTPGTASRLALDNTLEVRDFLNEGGQVLYTGKYAATQYAGQYLYDPTAENALCTDPAVAPRCRTLGGSGDGTNDTLQYWLGAYLVIDDAGMDEDGELFDVLGMDTPFTGLNWELGDDSAQNQDHTNSFITTSGILDPQQYPQFESWVAAGWDRPTGPFEPHNGDAYVYSQISDVSYKRLTRTIDVPAAGGELSFWTSYDTEAEWDHVAVEAHTPGEDDWTTLPDLNGSTSDSTGQSCPAGWRELHPQLDHYQTYDEAAVSCTATGSSGSWHAASGNSGGWRQWTVDLDAYAGGQVEVSIAYISDWSTQGLGVFVDDIQAPTADGTTSFENGDTGGWEVTGAPEGSAPNANDFIITTAAGFPEAAVVATPGSLMTGFGFEGIDDPLVRADWMGRALEHLLD
ncbi:M14 family zinc carboxypeptidase [Agromyces sp. NPDC058064]|uniref:M14 family metallopeptidase n=1 Tax=Agromyces sp. NPDC058064 TaxID=3346322 RepID=UPI0036D8382B